MTGCHRLICTVLLWCHCCKVAMCPFFISDSVAWTCSSEGEDDTEGELEDTPRAVPALDLTASLRLSQRSSSEHTPASQVCPASLAEQAQPSTE